MSAHGHASPWAPLRWLLLIIAGLWVLWYFTGGPERAAEQGNNPFLRPLEPIDTGETYGPSNSQSGTR